MPSSLLKRGDKSPTKSDLSENDLKNLFKKFVNKQLKHKDTQKIQQSESLPYLNVQRTSGTEDLLKAVEKNAKIQRAVDKVKKKLRHQEIPKEEKFNQRFRTFAKMKTFIDIRALMAQINNEGIADSNIIQQKFDFGQPLDEEFESEEEDIFDYGEIIKRTKVIIRQNQPSYERLALLRQIKRKDIDLEYDVPRNNYGLDEENMCIDEQKFYEHLDDLIQKEQKALNMTVEKKLEQDKLDQQRQLLQQKFQNELESQKEDYMKRLQNASPITERQFIEKSKKVLRLLERTTKQLYNKRQTIISPKEDLNFNLNLNVNLNLHSESHIQTPLKHHSIQVKKTKVTRFAQDANSTQRQEDLKSDQHRSAKSIEIPKNTNFITQNLPQLSQVEAQNFNNEITNNKLLRQGMQINGIMELKKYAYDNETNLKSFSTPKITKGLESLYSNNQRIRTNDSNRYLPGNQSRLKFQKMKMVTLPDQPTSNSPSRRYTTTVVVMKQRDKIVKLIDQVEKTQHEMKKEASKHKIQLNKMEDDVLNHMSKIGSQKLESLQYFSHSPTKQPGILKRGKNKSINLF